MNNFYTGLEIGSESAYIEKSLDISASGVFDGVICSACYYSRIGCSERYALEKVSPGLLGFGARNSKLAEIC